MKLTSMGMTNFRCFDSLDISFSRNLTVIIATNAGGKTSILDAIAYGFGPFLNRLPGVSGKKINKDIDLRVMDDNIKAPFLRLIHHAEEDMSWELLEKRDKSTDLRKFNAGKQFKESLKKHPKVGKKQILSYADSFVNAENGENAENKKQPYKLPIIAYYGTDRAFAPVKRRENFQKEFSRFEAYSGALNSKTNFRRLFEWFNAMEIREQRGVKEHQDLDYKLPVLEAVRQAICEVIPNVSNPRIKEGPLRFLVDLEQNGVIREFRVEQLSDGYQMALAMVMDIAARMGETNPDEDKILNTEGVVLIDEVDQHLHPEWQQRILADLIRTFPNVQFIVTTHSPQVLTTCKAENIRVLEQIDGVFQAHIPTRSPYGQDSSDALAIMNTNSKPELAILDQVSEYEQQVRAGNIDTPQALQLKQELDAADYIIADADLALWKFLAGQG
jgi:predicted ATP-binding protein involved in virulence